MILIDTSLYIEAAEKEEVRKILEGIVKKDFVLSCDPIEKEIARSCDFLRKIGKKKDSEELHLIYNGIKQGVIKLTERITSLKEHYSKEAHHLSKDQHKDIQNDLFIVASASVAGVKAIFSLNRKTMAADKMVEVYAKVNKMNGYTTPLFITQIEDLRKLL